jgi:Tol biopolymer transport system component
MRWILLIAALLTAALIVLPQVVPIQLELQLALVDREGKRTPVGTVPVSTFAPRISSNGLEVMYDTSNDGQLWIAKLSDFATKRRFGTGGYRGPLWADDNKRILYITDDGREETLFWRSADGTGTADLLAKPARAPESWSPKNNHISFITLGNSGDYDVYTYSVADKRVTPFVVVPGSAQHSSHFSPDGRWIAYASAETGRLEIYVRPFPAGTPVVRVSQNGGEHPLWSPDQKELFFDTGNQVFTAPITTAATFTAGTPVKLPITGYIQGPLRRQYDLMPDGKRFLMMFPPGR